MDKIIEQIDSSINKLKQEIKERNNSISILEKSKDELFKINNICPDCMGKGEEYIPTKSYGDPYHKSSDDWETCKRCNGTGKYIIVKNK